MKPPPTLFASGPEGRVAYQVVGDGPMDLVFMPFLGRWNLDIVWENPGIERFLRRLASFSRLILFNPRGTGVSDPIPRGAAASPEDWMLDSALVLDEVGSQQASVLAFEAATQVAVFLAATFPDRVSSLVLVDALATPGRADDYPWGYPPDALRKFIDLFAAYWGTGATLDFMSPELAKDERLRDWWARLERLSVTAAQTSMNTSVMTAWDTRGILSSVRAPTLVLSHTDVPWIRLGHGRYVADKIANARYVERPGFWGGVFWIEDVDWVLDETQTFFTGTRTAQAPDDRVLATVLFSDIVSSTERAAEMGDERWRRLLDEHDTLMHREIERFRGRAVKFTGDGVLATFDGPARAIRCAMALQEGVRELGFALRTGLHTGEVEIRGEDVGGIAVHIGARVMAEAQAGQVLVSGSIPPLVAGSGIDFEDLGPRVLKGIPGDWHLFKVMA